MKKLDEIKLQPGLLVCQFGITFGGLKLCLKKIKSEIHESNEIKGVI